MSEESQKSVSSLGPALLPQLNAECDGRLLDIRWFRTDWQRGGAATAYATLAGDTHLPEREVVIKFPVGPREYRVLVGLGATPAPTPRIAYHGTELGSFDMAWVVMERIGGEPLKANPTKPSFWMCAQALAQFYLRANECWPLTQHETSADWPELIAKSRDSAKLNAIPDAQRWSNTIHQVQRVLDRLLVKWHTRPANAWCHGDLHLANVMLRDAASPWSDHASGPAEPEAILFDFANVRCGHWIEDAVYLERQYWANKEVIKKIKPVSLIARARREAGLPSEDHTQLATIRRILLAACVPAFLDREGHPSYLAAALETLEAQLAIVKL